MIYRVSICGSRGALVGTVDYKGGSTFRCVFGQCCRELANFNEQCVRSARMMRSVIRSYFTIL